MNKWQKIGTAVGICNISLAAAHVVNQLIFKSSTADNLTTDIDNQKYKWKFGDINYKVKGTGKPLLLIHDSISCSSMHEWSKTYKALSKNHTVYALDLIGFGNSDKPNITYTTYLYVQMINDFVKNIIGKRTDVIVSGASCPAVIMACYSNKSLFDKIIMVNPVSITEAMKIPGKRSNMLRALLNSPIIGTSIYNIINSKHFIKKRFEHRLYNIKHSLSTDDINIMHESAHLSGSYSKFYNTSKKCHFTTASIKRAIEQIDNCMYIIYGEHEQSYKNILSEYISTNPSIEVSKVSNAAHYPQLENSRDFIDKSLIYLYN